jgi:NAD(P)-dependent dehydrogenase (short-subunit alcohol dehydrogenase family)
MTADQVLPGFRLDGHRALVIGGGTGIGRAVALGLAAAGADLTLTGRRREPLDEAAADVRALGRRAAVYLADASDDGQLAALADAVAADGGPPHILVNAQGTMRLRAAVDVSADDYTSQMDTNVRSVWLACTRFGRAMLARGSGCIVNIASMASFRSPAGNAIYAVGKHGVRALTESLAAEWAAGGVRVNAIAPGVFITDLNRTTMVGERRARTLARVPMGRLGELPELAGAAVFLASPSASYVTGVTLPVDGGFLVAG